jgi:hypothetical protein
VESVFVLESLPCHGVALCRGGDRVRGTKSWRQLVVLLAPSLASIAVLFRFNHIMGHLGRFYYPFLPFFVAAGIVEVDGWMAGHERAAVWPRGSLRERRSGVRRRPWLPSQPAMLRFRSRPTRTKRAAKNIHRNP